jgi:hypothetical protein
MAHARLWLSVLLACLLADPAAPSAAREPPPAVPTSISCSATINGPTPLPPSATRKREARLQARRTDLQSVPPTWDDVQVVLDEEVRRLREPYRSALLLCVVEGKTVPAAAELGVKTGTLSCRLARARRRLRQQLSRRGIELTAVLAALSVAQEGGKAAVPAALAGATIRLGLSVAAGEPAAVIPTHIAALAAGVTRAMFLSKTKIAAALVLAAGLLLAGGGALARKALSAGEPPAGSRKEAATSKKPEPAAGKDGAKLPAAEDKDSLAYRGFAATKGGIDKGVPLAEDGLR